MVARKLHMPSRPRHENVGIRALVSPSLRHPCESRPPVWPPSPGPCPRNRLRRTLQRLYHRRDGLGVRTRFHPQHDTIDLQFDSAAWPRCRSPSALRPGRRSHRCRSLRRRLDHHRHEGRHDRSSLRFDPGLPAPPEDLLRAKTVTARHFRHHRSRRQRLFQDPRLVVRRPVPTAASPVDDPTRRNGRSGSSLRSNPDTKRSSPWIVRLSAHRKKRKVGPRRRLHITGAGQKSKAPHMLA